MQIAQVVARISEEASGPSYSVPRLCQSLAADAEDVALFVLGAVPPKNRAYRISAHRSWKFPARLGVSPSMRAALREEAMGCDVVHNHGLWMMPNVYSGQLGQSGGGCRLVVSPRGTLSAWALARSRWSKRALWWGGQRRTMARADAFHATSEQEYEDIRRAGFAAPVAVIPNGIDLPIVAEAPRRFGERRQLLFFGRVHPTKNLDGLLRAWRLVQESFGDWDLMLCGPGDPGYRRELQGLAAELGCERVAFGDPAYGEAKAQRYRGADLCVLPSHSENFGMVVAEALSYGVPVLASQGTPWSGLVEQGCGFWVPGSIEGLAAGLRESLGQTETQLVAAGAAGRRWVEEDYSWDRVASQMRAVYRWLVDGGDVPAWVRL